MMPIPQPPVQTPVTDRVAADLLRVRHRVSIWDVTAEEYEAISRELKEHRKRAGLPLWVGPDHGGLLLCGVELRVMP